MMGGKPEPEPPHANDDDEFDDEATNRKRRAAFDEEARQTPSGDYAPGDKPHASHVVKMIAFLQAIMRTPDPGSALYIVSLPNERRKACEKWDDARPRSVEALINPFSEDAAFHLQDFVVKHGGPGRAIFVSTAPVSHSEALGNQKDAKAHNRAERAKVRADPTHKPVYRPTSLRRKDFISQISCLAFEIDFKDHTVNSPEELLHRTVNGFLGSPLRPAIINRSGGGLHVFIPLEGTLEATPGNIARVEAATGRLIDLYGGDPNAHDVGHLLRLPYTFNCKPRYGRPILIEPVEGLDSGRRVNIEEVEAALGENPAGLYAASEWKKPKRANRREGRDGNPFESKGDSHDWFNPAVALAGDANRTDVLRVVGHLAWCGVGEEAAKAFLAAWAARFSEVRCLNWNAIGIHLDGWMKQFVDDVAKARREGRDIDALRSAFVEDWGAGSDGVESYMAERAYYALNDLMFDKPAQCALREAFKGIFKPSPRQEETMQDDAAGAGAKAGAEEHWDSAADEEKAEPGRASNAPPFGWERDRAGKLKSNSYKNTRLAIDEIRIEARYDEFHDRKTLGGEFKGELSDASARRVRDAIISKFGFDPGKGNVQEGLEYACETNRFDPVLEYLNGLAWDRTPRIDRLLPVYMGADDTPLNRAFGRKTLLAAVRRVREPGCKFDTMLVLEGEQGSGKSSAVQILARQKENFSDAPIKWDDPKAQQEAVTGVWIFEVGELTGLRKADVEHVKNILSRSVDSARPAYGRFRVDKPRRCIFIGTTNGGEQAGYLNDHTGNRRFWPVRTGEIDLEALERDRDQLWAEAALLEQFGEELTIDPSLYADAAEQQDRRRVRDPWDDVFANVRGERGNGVERIGTAELLLEQLSMKPGQMTSAIYARLAVVMNRLGWSGPKDIRVRYPMGTDGTRPFGIAVMKGYERPLSDL